MGLQRDLDGALRDGCRMGCCRSQDPASCRRERERVSGSRSCLHSIDLRVSDLGAVGVRSGVADVALSQRARAGGSRGRSGNRVWHAVALSRQFRSCDHVLLGWSECPERHTNCGCVHRVSRNGRGSAVRSMFVGGVGRTG